MTVKSSCNCRSKGACPLEGNCQVNDVIYKCVASTSMNPDKTYFRTAEGEFKKRYYNHTKSFKHKKNANDTGLAKYLWDIKERYHETPILKWSIVKTVPGYSNISKKCLLCLHEKLEILNFPQQEHLFNKRSELISKCRHVNKYLLCNYNSND